MCVFVGGQGNVVLRVTVMVRECGDRWSYVYERTRSSGKGVDTCVDML